MDISIIVPCYNIEEYIPHLLSSLEEQNTEGIEIEYIFVMNKCTDNTEQIVSECSLNCQILQCEDKGCGLARNVGLDHATGKYIWFIDGDDWLTDTNAIKDIYEFALKHEESPMIRIPFTSNLFKRNYFSMVWQYLIKRDFIGGLRFRKIQPSEDDVFIQELLTRLGYDWNTYLSMPTVDRPLYYYFYMRKGSNMQRFVHGEDINR